MNTRDQTADGASSDAGGAQSVDRAITVLEIVGALGEANVSEVALAVGVHRSTISRLLVVLERRGMVEVAGPRGRYRLGPGILRLAGAVTAGLDLTVQGAAASDELAAHLGETVNIAVMLGDSAVNIYQAEGGGAITVDSWVGRPTPLHATSSGKMLLAWAEEAAIGRDLEAFTPQTVTDPRILREQLARARSDGFAMTVGELEDGLNAIAVPVRGPRGVVIAALSASGPSYRLTPELMASHVAALAEAAVRIGYQMGNLR